MLGDPTQRELIKLPSGALWRTETKLNVINRTQIYEKATLTLKREGQPFDFTLQLDEVREDEKSKSMAFELSAGIEFARSYGEDGEAIFSWKDVESKFGYEFIVGNDITAPTIEMFHLLLAQCIYETVQRRPHPEAKDDEIQSLMIVKRQDEETLAIRETGDGTTIKIDGEETVFQSESAHFYVFDSASGLFIPKNEDPVRVVISLNSIGNKGNSSKSIFHMNIVDDATTSVIHRQLIDPDATLHTDRRNFSFIWCHFNEEGVTWTFSLRFEDAVSLMEMSNAVGHTVYEILNNAKMAEDDRDYLLNSFPMEDVQLTNAPAISDSEEEEEERQESSDDGYQFQFQSESESEEDHSGDETYGKDKSGSVNQQLAVGYKHDRSFVTRGHSISVFKHTADDSIKLHANIEKVKTANGKRIFSPSKMMLHEEDRTMLLMDGTDSSKLYKMDLEYGKVVEDWEIHPHNSGKALTAILPDTKYAQLTSNPTLIGLTSNSLFRIDPRLPGAKRVDSEMKQYTVKNDFSCGATTGSGELAVASAKGEIRLFNKLDKRAKTLLPGFGDAILGIDVTESGRWIVATCKTYLLLISTEIPGEDSLGFSKPMGANKPTPKRLQLRPEHVAYMGAPISFTAARFSTGPTEERAIITSTGPYVITWNLRRIKQGHLWDYQIRKYEDKVVADNFRYGMDRSIVVTLPNHVTMISKRSLATPSATIFGSKPTREYKD
jgi:hypothetical protein